jgi:hypothetical protein
MSKVLCSVFFFLFSVLLVEINNWSMLKEMFSIGDGLETALYQEWMK